MNAPKVTIVGAGIVGLAAAAVLVSRGCSVRVVDRTGPAAGASQGNAGGIASTDVMPLASPGIWKDALTWLADPVGPLSVRPAYALRILPWILRFLFASRAGQVKKSANAIAMLNSGALPAWERVWRLTGTHNQVHYNGCLQVFDRTDKLNAKRSVWAMQRQYGIDIQELSGDEIRKREPDLSSSIKGGCFVPGWAHMDDPKKLCLSLAEWLAAQGVDFHTQTVVRLETEGSGIRLVNEDGSLSLCEKAVIACGAWSKTLAAGLGDTVPLDTERGYNITVPDPGIDVRNFIMLPGHGFAISPLETGLRIGGAVEFGGLDLAPNWRRIDAMVAKARKVFPALDASQGARWMGFRPSLPDSLPVIGASSASPDIFYAFGHAHHGLTQAAITAELLAAMVFDDTLPLDPHPFRATRF